MCSIIAGLTALSGIVQYQATQDQAAAEAARYEMEAANYRNQALVDQQNAAIEGKKQEVIADNYARQEKELRDRRRIIAGQNRAQAGAAGIAQAGSVLDLLAAGDEAYAQDKMTLLSNQRNDNYSSRIQQMNFVNSSENNMVSSRNALKSADYARDIGRTQGLMTILGTAASIYGSVAGGGGSSSNTASASGSGTGGYSVPTSASSNIGHTTASWNLNSGYSFTGKTPGTWGHNLYKPKNYFSYR